MERKITFNSFWGVLIVVYFFLLIYVAKFPAYAQIITRFVTPGFFLMVFLRFGFKSRLMPREFYVWFLFVAWSFTGLLFVKDQTAFWRYEQLLLGNLMLMFIVYSLQKRQQIFEYLLIGIIVGSLAVFIDSMLNVGSLLDSLARTGVSGITRNPNSFGFLMLLGIFATAFFWDFKKGSGQYKWLQMALIGIFTLGILLSASRKNFLTLGLFVLLWFFFCYRQDIKNPVRFFGVLILLFAIGYFSFDYILENTHLGVRINSAANETSNPKRLMLYQEGWQMFKNNPFYGVGLGNFAVNSNFGTFSHSDLMELLATTGLPGLILYLEIYRNLLKRVRKLKRFYTEGMSLYRLNLIIPVIVSFIFLGVGATIFTDIIIFSLIAGIIGYVSSMAAQVAEEAPQSMLNLESIES